MKDYLNTFLILLTVQLAITLSPVSLFADDGEIISYKEQGLELSLVKETKNKNDQLGSETLRLRISTKKLTESTVFSLENPSRIVIDLQGPVIKKNRSLKIPPGMSFSMIRVGTHPNKVRIVIDVNSQKIPSYQWKTRGNDAVLTISSALETTSESNTLESIPKIAIITPTIKPVITSLSEPSPTPEIVKGDEIEALINRKPKSSPTPSPTSIEEEIISEITLDIDKESFTPTAIPTVIEESDKAASSETALSIEKEVLVVSGPVLSSIDFAYSEEADPKPVIKLKLGERSQFQLERTNEKNYIIKIGGFRLGKKALSLPQFPPHDFLGFTLISSKEKKEGLEITIGVEEGARIQATPNGDEIWVSKITDLKPINSLPISKPRKSSAPPLKGR